MSGSNGQTKDIDVLTDREVLLGIAEGLAALVEDFEDFREEVMEKFANFGIEESAYGIERLLDED